MGGGGQLANNVTSKVRHQGTPKRHTNKYLSSQARNARYVPQWYTGNQKLPTPWRFLFHFPRNRLVACTRIALFWRSQ